MNADIARRLARLEADQTPKRILDTSFSPALRLLRLLIAVHLGNLQSHEPVAAGVAKALGYGNPLEMRAALMAKGEITLDWSNRHNEAVKRMFAGAEGIPQARAALLRLFEDLPAWAHTHSFAADPDFDTAAEWVSL
jgi:hypothetical protein